MSFKNMKQHNTIIRYAAFLALAIVLTACGRDRNDPGIQYAPEMYESMPLEPFTQVQDSLAPFKDKRNQQLPPEGTIPRGGHAAFDIPATARDSAATIALKNPVPLTEEVMEEGKVLYDRFCGVCHGAQGKGNGAVAKNEAITPAAYDDAKISKYTAGQLYHAIMYGQGVMGSYASQLDYEERWKVVHYVQTLQGKDAAASDEGATEDGDAADEGAEEVEDPGNNGGGEEESHEEGHDENGEHE